MKLYDAVMRLEGWSNPISLDIGDYYMHDCGRVYLLLIEEINTLKLIILILCLKRKPV